MKRVWRYFTAGALLSVVLLAGIAAAQGGGMTIAKNWNIITISGTTNLAAGDRLQWNVVSASFTPTQKGTAGGFSGAAGTTVVQAGSPLNTFSIEVDVSGFPPDEYLVTVQSVETGVTESAQFVLPLTPVPTPVTTTPATTPATPATTAATTLATSPATRPTATPLPGFLALGAFGVTAFNLLRRR